MEAARARTWDLFCRVIDNHGDIGVCWRLAADLASRGERVRLWVDDASALAWMAPRGARIVEVRHWPLKDHDAVWIDVVPGDVVIEAFGCELPAGFVRRMVSSALAAPQWINLEYLSAEGYVERAHRLPSPQTSGPGAGLRKVFFYPGFTDRTGGLIREPDLEARRRAFDAPAWLDAHGAETRDGERIVSLFCYAQPVLAELVESLAERPTLLLVTAGRARAQVDELLGPSRRRGALRALPLAPSTQRDYDHVLWASDMNFVRGEDSFVRAQWAAKPFVWQIYPQSDGVHLRKLDAFLTRFLEGGDADLAPFVRGVFAAWNGAPSAPARATNQVLRWPEEPMVRWARHCEAWRASLAGQADLTSQLIGLVTERR